MSAAPATLPLDAPPADMRQRILRATLELIAADGAGAITNRRVAAAAKVSLGSLTYHFSSQTELLRDSLLLHVEEETARREEIARNLATRNPSLDEVTHEIEQLAAGAADIPQQIAELELHLHAARDPHSETPRGAASQLTSRSPQRRSPRSESPKASALPPPSWR